MRILLAEDELALSRALAKLLEKNNYTVDAVYNGIDAIEYLMYGCYDVAILDIMMPKMDGITAIKKIRENGNNTPILILTAKSECDDKVLGLDSGANYYLTKPFNINELLAALRAITRSSEVLDKKIKFGNITLDCSTFELFSDNKSYRLANKEFQLIEIFMKNPQKIYSSEYLMDKVWSYDTNAEINVVWTYISYLRKKLNALNANITIKTSRNIGYFLEKKND